MELADLLASFSFFLYLRHTNKHRMLSILIPTYNCDCVQLVHDLHGQAELLGIDYEIIVIDDASSSLDCKQRNRAINGLSHCRYVELGNNLGRARIRNRLADEAQYEWLLFMDSDAEVISSSFVADYLKCPDADVVCGGLCHADTLPSPEVSLRYAYEKRADRRRAARYRAARPYEQFTPFNFMIRRETFQRIRFDERITEYGHEDTLFGIELGKRNANVLHIDNPLRHVGLENNELFLEKTRAALRNLAVMEEPMQGHSSLLSAYRLLRGVGMNRCVGRWFARKEQSLVKCLTKENPSILLFFIYKLGYFCTHQQG